MLRELTASIELRAIDSYLARATTCSRS